MKILFLKFNNLLKVENLSHASSLEFYKFIKIIGKNHTVYTPALSNKFHDDINFISLDELEDASFDELVIFSGLVREEKYNELNKFLYKIINNFKRKIHYIATDTRYFLPDDDMFKLTNYNINLITSNFIFYEDLKKFLNNSTFFKDYKTIKINHLFFNFFNDRKPCEFINTKRKDYCYAGSYREGHRNEKLKKYVFNDKINTEIYGTFTKEQLENITNKEFKIEKYVSHEDVINTLNNKYYASILINDDDIFNGGFPPRIIETVFSNSILFIDKDSYDRNIVFKDAELVDFTYVNSIDNIIEKINYLKKNENYFKRLIDKQKFDVEELFKMNVNNIIIK